MSMMLSSPTPPAVPPQPAARWEPPSITWSVLRRFLERHWLFILLVFLGTVAGTYGVLSVMTERYETESKLLVKLGRENVDPPATAHGNVLVTGLRLQDQQNEIQVLRSAQVIAQVVDELGVEAFRAQPAAPASLLGWLKHLARQAARGIKNGYNEALIAVGLKKRLGERDTAIQTILEDTVVEAEKDSDVIAIRTRMANPALAEAVQSKLIEIYLGVRNRVRKDYGVAEFLEAEVASARSKLADLEEQKEQLKRSHSISSAEEQQRLLLQQVRELADAAMLTRTDIATLEQQNEALRKQLAGMPEQIRSAQQEVTNSVATSLRERLVDLRAQLASVLTKYQPDSTVARNLQSEIDDLESQLRAEAATVTGSATYQVNPLRQTLEARLEENRVNLEGLRSRLQRQEQALAQLQGELRQLDAAAAQLRDLERARQISEEQYRSLVERRQRAQIESQLENSSVSNVNVLQAPASSPNPVYPPKMLVFYLSLAVGLVLGVLLALFVDYLDDRVRDPQQAEMLLEAPCLGNIETAPETLIR